MLRRCNKDVKYMSKKMGISEIMATILANRGIWGEREISAFLNPSIDNLLDPSIMKDMEKGTDIIHKAILHSENIVIYGDYDVDGVMSTYILYCGLLRCGAKVRYHIPDRIEEGYGINIKSIERLKGEGCEVIITCDNGIAALEQVKRAKELGITVVITDHHHVFFEELENGEKKYLIPEADAVIDPKQQCCKYPFKQLCGAGVSFKFIQVLYKKFNLSDKECYDFIQYAAIGTICDVMDLVDENRIIVKKGLDMINNTKNLGLKALVNETCLNDKNITSYHIGFIIGPCINATGRLENASLALKLLLCKDKDEAFKLARKLNELNVQRQYMTSKSLNDIICKMESSAMKEDKVLVIYHKETHESIAGIVAGKLKDRFNLPVIVITQGKDVLKGSGRSIEGYNMFEELVKCRKLIEKFGGHPLAAGLSILEKNVDKLREDLNKNCTLEEKDLTPKIRIDKRLPLEYISFHILEELKKLEPFGKGNIAPLFGEKNVEVFRIYFMGKDKNVLKLFCRLQSSLKKIDAISFDGGEKFKKLIFEVYGKNSGNKILSNNFNSIKMDFIFLPYVNEFNGVKNLQLVIKDFRFSLR